MMREAFRFVGFEEVLDARTLMVNMLLNGDAWNGASADSTAAASYVSGYGRLHAHWPSDYNLSGPWGWGTQVFHMNQGDTITWPVWDAGPESSDITQWKWAFTWFDQNLGSTANVDIRVIDTCHGNANVRITNSWDLRKRIVLRQPDIAGKCLAMRAYATNVPSGGIDVFSADYFHGGDPDNEH
jgi:hypothetical protein